MALSVLLTSKPRGMNQLCKLSSFYSELEEEEEEAGAPRHSKRSQKANHSVVRVCALHCLGLVISFGMSLDGAADGWMACKKSRERRSTHSAASVVLSEGRV